MASTSQTAVNAHAASTPVPTVAPSPSATPVVHAATHAAAHLSSLVSYINSHQVAFVGVLAAVMFVAQNFINSVPALKGEEDAVSQQAQDIKRELVAAGLPAVVLALGSLLQGTNLMAYWLVVYPVAKGYFNLWKAAKVAAQKMLASAANTVAPANKGPVG